MLLIKHVALHGWCAVHVRDLLAEDAAQVDSFAFQGGSEEAVADAEQFGVQIQILHLEQRW